MNTKENKMYKLIWTNTLESCMSDSIYHSITAIKRLICHCALLALCNPLAVQVMLKWCFNSFGELLVRCDVKVMWIACRRLFVDMRCESDLKCSKIIFRWNMMSKWCEMYADDFSLKCDVKMMWNVMWHLGQIRWWSDVCVSGCFAYVVLGMRGH